MINKMLLTAATLTVLSAPAFAQTNIYQGQIDVNSLNSSNVGQVTFGSSSSAGPLQGTNLNQNAGNQYNLAGQAVVGGLLAVNGSAIINQGAGAYNVLPGNTSAGADLTASSLNSNVANGSSKLFGSQMAVYGSQTGANVINQAAIAGQTAGSSFDFNQALNPLGTATVNATSSNTMAGTATSGALVVGNGVQSASNSLNTALFVGASAAGTANTVNLQQKSGVVGVTTTNSAIGNVTNGGGATIDPAISNLGQVSQTDLNTLAVGAGSTVLNGSQDQKGAASIQFGNTAVAYTGSNSGAYSAGYNVDWRSTAGIGATNINSTAQTAAVNVNSVSGSADLSLAGAGGIGSFDQTYKSTLSSPTSNVYDGVVNGMVSNTGTGNASIAGTLSTANGRTTTSTSQNLSLSGNSLSGSSLTGSVAQTATGLTSATSTGTGLTPAPAGYMNVALANTAGGNSSISNLAQSGSQTYNSVAAGSASGLMLDQKAGGVINGGNIQMALANGNATITGASQNTTLGANLVSVGALGGTNSLTQDAGTLTMSNVNTLGTGPRSLNGSTGPNNSTVTGVQSAVNTINAVTR